MIKTSEIKIYDNLVLNVTYNYIDAKISVDCNIPSDPVKIEIQHIELIKGNLTTLLSEFDGWEWLETKLYELND